MQRRDVTMIDDLPEVEDLGDTRPKNFENKDVLNMIPEEHHNKYRKFIRPTENHSFPNQSGMNAYSDRTQHLPMTNQPQQGQALRPQIPMQNPYQYVNHQAGHPGQQPIQQGQPIGQQGHPGQQPVHPGQYHRYGQQPIYQQPREHYIPQNHIYSPNNHTDFAEMFEHNVSCPSFAQHAQNCSVCSQLYKCDRTIYIIIIIVLCIICILLIKKVLNL